MDDLRIAVVGIGATGAVLAAALLSKDPDTILIDPGPGLEDAVRKHGIRISGEISFNTPVRHFFSRIAHARKLKPNLIFVATKTFHLPHVVEELRNRVLDIKGEGVVMHDHRQFWSIFLHSLDRENTHVIHLR